MRHLGAHIAHIAPGRVHIVLPGRPEVTQQEGYFHAGATSAIADSAGGYAAFTLFPENTSVLTVEYKINLLAPAVGDHIEAVGTDRGGYHAEVRQPRRRGACGVLVGRRAARDKWHIRDRICRPAQLQPGPTCLNSTPRFL